MARNNPNIKFVWLLSFLHICFIVVSSFNLVLAQQKAERVYMYLDYFQSNETKYLVAECKWRDGSDFKQLGGIEVDFSVETDSADITLASIVTGEDGKARLDLNDIEIGSDSNGVTHYRTEFNGTEEYRKASKSLSVKEIELRFETKIVDSLKMITVIGEEKVKDGRLPIEESDLQILVKRLYSDLPVIEGTMEEGEFEVEFPDNIPGDTNGDLWIIARITDHDDYGNVETRQKITWGKPVSYAIGKRPRALWSRAPIWMIGVVWVAFLLIWYHYFLAVGKLFKIKKL